MNYKKSFIEAFILAILINDNKVLYLTVCYNVTTNLYYLITF